MVVFINATIGPGQKKAQPKKKKKCKAYRGVYKQHYKSWVLQGPIVAFINATIGLGSYKGL